MRAECIDCKEGEACCGFCEHFQTSETKFRSKEGFCELQKDNVMPNRNACDDFYCLYVKEVGVKT